jgi:hypothetical protein
MSPRTEEFFCKWGGPTIKHRELSTDSDRNTPPKSNESPSGLLVATEGRNRTNNEDR